MSLFKRESRYYRLFPMFPHNLDQLQSIRANSRERVESFSLKCYALFFFAFFYTSISRSMVSFYTNDYRIRRIFKTESNREIFTFSILRKNSSCYW